MAVDEEPDRRGRVAVWIDADRQNPHLAPLRPQLAQRAAEVVRNQRTDVRAARVQEGDDPERAVEGGEVHELPGLVPEHEVCCWRGASDLTASEARSRACDFRSPPQAVTAPSTTPIAINATVSARSRPIR